MTSQTNEQALETAIQLALTGLTTEGIKENDPGASVAEASEQYRSGKGYFMGEPLDFNARYAIDERRFWSFLEETQPEELKKLQRHSDWKRKILERLDRMITKYGVLRSLKKGLEVDDAYFTLFYQLPQPSSSPRVKKLFEDNQFSVTRQVAFSLENPREEIDLAIFVNGLPIITAELKNPWTGQNAKVHGQNQYKFDRDIRQPLLQFGRCLVHFAVDTDEVYMTTKLNAAQTFFLPFNKGFNHGKGNPVNVSGHKTAYLWEEVLTRESLSNLIQHFIRLDGKHKDPLNTRTLYFPRYHQMDVVRRIIDHAGKVGVGQTYLIQHSAGSGKSNSITWAAFQLIETYPQAEGIPGSKGMGRPLFDSVIVVTDRRLLDKQIRENIKEFSEVGNIVAHAHNSQELRTSLEMGKKIIITTIQKFPFIVDEISDLSDRNFAVLIDEAHSSQSGVAHGKLNAAMGKKSEDGEQDEDAEDYQELINRAMKARKMRGNASYLAFTATPKNSTLEKFGTHQQDGSFRPFHLYSMKQAIEEGFILDVLANYTTYKSYYEIAQSIKENPLFDAVKAQKKLKAFVESDPRTIETKAEIMLDHLIPNLVNKKKLKGKAKAMVVTQSIKSAILYYKALNRLLEKRGNPFRILVAFSGSKTVDGMEYTEESINELHAHLDTGKSTDPGYIQDKLARYFDMDEYRILVVANKYLTGFDQQKLTAMYVDKKLQGVLAVQALSRLNRSAPKLGKKTEDLFILDFFNSTEEIKRSFDPFYTSTTLSEATDINVLHELKVFLDDSEVYEQSEVDSFNEGYFKGVDAQKLSPIIDRAAQRFNADLELLDEEKADLKIKAKQFVKIYGQMASIMPFEMLAWEKLFWFLKFLIPKLVVKDPDADNLDELLHSVDLSTYGLERTKLNAAIGMDDSETELDPQNPNPRGAHGPKEEDFLENIIRNFNERWFHGWEATPDEQRVKFIQIGKQVWAHPDYESKVANNPDVQNSDLALRRIIDEIMGQQRRKEMDLYRLYAKDEGFYQAFFDTMKRMVKGIGT